MNGGSVPEYYLKMKLDISCAEVIKAKLEHLMQINMILESLLESFNQFNMTYNMNKLKHTCSKLMHELKSDKKFLVKP